MSSVPTSVSPVGTMASHFRKINYRLASLERATGSGAVTLEARIVQLEGQVAALQLIVDALNPPPS